MTETEINFLQFSKSLNFNQWNVKGLLNKQIIYKSLMKFGDLKKFNSNNNNNNNFENDLSGLIINALLKEINSTRNDKIINEETKINVDDLDSALHDIENDVQMQISDKHWIENMIEECFENTHEQNIVSKWFEKVDKVSRQPFIKYNNCFSEEYKKTMRSFKSENISRKLFILWNCCYNIYPSYPTLSFDKELAQDTCFPVLGSQYILSEMRKMKWTKSKNDDDIYEIDSVTSVWNKSNKNYKIRRNNVGWTISGEGEFDGHGVVKANFGVKGMQKKGKWYYEVKLETSSMMMRDMKLGFVTNEMGNDYMFGHYIQEELV